MKKKQPKRKKQAMPKTLKKTISEPTNTTDLLGTQPLTRTEKSKLTGSHRRCSLRLRNSLTFHWNVLRYHYRKNGGRQQDCRLFAITQKGLCSFSRACKLGWNRRFQGRTAK